MQFKKYVKYYRRKLSHSSTFINLLAFFGYHFIRLYLKTVKIKIIIDPALKTIDRCQVLTGFWHGSQFLLLATARSWPSVVLVDKSWAGNIQAQILKRFGFIVIRGSTKHSPSKALMMMFKALKQGNAGSFALDGPRGPRHQSKPGIIYLSQKIGHPIIPVVTWLRHHWTLKRTWCKYQLPIPFSEAVAYFGKPYSPDPSIAATTLTTTLNERLFHDAEYLRELFKNS